MANVTEIVKFAGPDKDGCYKVLSTKNTYIVDPGEVYTRSVYQELVDKAQRRPTHKKLDVSCVEAKFPGAELVRFGMEPGITSFGAEPGIKVLDKLKD